MNNPPDIYLGRDMFGLIISFTDDKTFCTCSSVNKVFYHFYIKQKANRKIRNVTSGAIYNITFSKLFQPEYSFNSDRYDAYSWNINNIIKNIDPISNDRHVRDIKILFWPLLNMKLWWTRECKLTKIKNYRNIDIAHKFSFDAWNYIASKNVTKEIIFYMDEFGELDYAVHENRDSIILVKVKFNFKLSKISPSNRSLECILTHNEVDHIIYTYDKDYTDFLKRYRAMLITRELL